MSVQLWWSAPPEYDYELQVVRKVCEGLARQPDDFFVLANVPIYPQAQKPQQLDIVVLVDKTIFVLELKNTEGLPVRGNASGAWVCDSGKVWAAPNPLEQMGRQYYAFREWLLENRASFLPEQHVLATEDVKAWWDIKKFVVFCPSRNPRGKIVLPSNSFLSGSKGDVIGEDELLSVLVDPAWRNQRRCFDFTEGVVREIAFLLRLQPELPKSSDSHGDTPTVTGKPDRPANPTDRRDEERHQPRLRAVRGLVICLLLLACAGAASWYFGWPVAHRIEAPTAYKYMGRRAIVTVHVEGVGECGRSVCFYDQRLDSDSPTNFSVEVTDLRNASALGYSTGQHVRVGPAWIGKAGSGRPQIETRRSGIRLL